MRHVAIPSVLVLATSVSLGGCGIFGDSRPGIAKVDDLVDRVEHVYVEAELARESAREAVRSLRALTDPSFAGDVVQAYTELTALLEASEEQAGRLRDSVREMESAAGPVFDQWETDVAAISNDRMRQRSEDRLAASQTRFDEIVAAVDPVLADFDELNRSLKDVTLFLANDFNASALADVEAEIQAATGAADELGGQIEMGLVAARVYLDAASMPGGAPQTAAPQR